MSIRVEGKCDSVPPPENNRGDIYRHRDGGYYQLHKLPSGKWALFHLSGGYWSKDDHQTPDDVFKGFGHLFTKLQPGDSVTLAVE